MRLVIQRVCSARVETEGHVVGAIDQGLLVLVGVGKNDTKGDVNFLAEKLGKMRIMADENKKMNKSVLETKSSILMVSQFTLYSDTTSGNRPSFIDAGEPELAKKLYEMLVDEVKKYDIPIQTGKFGSYMKIFADLDGPVTIIIDSDDTNLLDN